MKRRVVRENNPHDSRCDESEKVESPLKITPVLSPLGRQNYCPPLRFEIPRREPIGPRLYISSRPSINIYKIASADGGLIQLHQRYHGPAFHVTQRYTYYRCLFLILDAPWITTSVHRFFIHGRGCKLSRRETSKVRIRFELIFFIFFFFSKRVNFL